MTLKIPLFAGDYQTMMALNTKSASKLLFEECEFPIAHGASKILNEQDLFFQLTKLIIKYPQVSHWIFKVNNEVFGRGIACFSID